MAHDVVIPQWYVINLIKVLVKFRVCYGVRSTSPIPTQSYGDYSSANVSDISKLMIENPTTMFSLIDWSGDAVSNFSAYTMHKMELALSNDESNNVLSVDIECGWWDMYSHVFLTVNRRLKDSKR